MNAFMPRGTNTRLFSISYTAPSIVLNAGLPSSTVTVSSEETVLSCSNTSFVVMAAVRVNSVSPEGINTICVLSAVYSTLSTSAKEVFPPASSMAARSEQPANASAAMLVTFAGMVMELMGQFRKVLLSIDLRPSPRTASVRSSQFAKAYAPMLVTVLGMTISLSAEPSKAFLPMVVTLAGMVMEVMPVSAKALAPISRQLLSSAKVTRFRL